MLTSNQKQAEQNIVGMEKTIASERRKLKRNRNTTSLFLGVSICLIIGTVMGMVIVNVESAIFRVMMAMSLCIYFGAMFIFVKGYRRYKKAVKFRIENISQTIKMQKKLLENEDKINM